MGELVSWWVGGWVGCDRCVGCFFLLASAVFVRVLGCMFWLLFGGLFFFARFCATAKVALSILPLPCTSKGFEDAALY